MNLLDPDRSVAQKRYVIEKMRQNKLETVTCKVKNNKKKFTINKNVLLYVIFGSLIMFGSVVFSTDKFIVSADKLNNANGEVLGEFTAPSPSPLIPKTKKSAISSYIKGDNRVLALKKFLESKGSPVAPFAYTFIKTADEVGLDYRLVASISGVESGFCKVTTLRLDSTLPSHNCWGWGKNGKKFSEFNTWEEGIITITRGIAKGYGKDANPDSMAYNYCHSCRGSSKWQDTVKGYMGDIAALEKKLK